jgi:uracil-DNA glycosylase family 4
VKGTYVPGIGSNNAKLAIVGIAPGDEEVKKGQPFVGPSGSILQSDLRDAGISINECYRTNIFKYKLPNNEFKRYQEMGLSLPDAMADLSQEIYDLNPNCILGLGDPVLYSLAGKSGKHNGINVWRGSILSVLGRKAIFTWHPAAELHGQGEGQWRSWQKYVRKFDVKRAVEQSQFKELRLPSRLLHVARSSSDVYRFFEKYKNHEYLSVDIEAIESIPVCISFAFTIHEGFCVPLWNELPINCINKAHPKKSYNYNLKVSTIPSDDLAFIWQIIASVLLDTKYKIIGQNFKYDESKLNSLGFYIHSLFWDTLIGSHCRSSEMPKGLAFNTSIDTEEPYYKFEGRDFIPGKDNIDDLLLYGAKDAPVTLEIFYAQKKDLSKIPQGIEHATWRMQLHKAYLQVDSTGFRVDELERKNLIYKYIQWLVKLEQELFEIVKQFGVTEPINIASPQQCSHLLYEVLKIPKREGTGEQVITALLGNVVKDAPKVRVCEILLEWRRVNKSLGYLKAEPDYDGRMKTNFMICGTENFRTSTNVLEPPVRPEQKGWAFQTVSKHGDIGQDLRSILITDPGYVIVNIDQSQAEARVCSLLADDEDTLRSYDTGDKHALTASKFFGGTEAHYSKKILGYECPERFVGKTLRHAYHLDIGKREAMINVNTDARKYKIPIKISEYRAGECLKILAKDTPKIKTIFHDTIQRLLRDNRRIHGTYGASRYFFDEMDTRDLWKGAYSFIPQQTVSDKTKQVMLKVFKNLWDVKIACESHDALTFLIRESVVDDRIEEIQSYFAEPIDFSRCSIPRRALVIPTDVEISEFNYCDLKKYRRSNADRSVSSKIS